jgi:multisubunit Na+/H+ antiporter MnhE subunit
MIGTVVRACWYAAIYLLVVNSVAPGDLFVGGVLGLAVAFALRSEHEREHSEPALVRARATAGTLAQTASEVVRGTWRTARFCLGGAARPGLVEIPRGERSPAAVALWGVLTGEAPDEYPVDLDAERDVLIVHLVDASDPQAVRARHEHTYDTWQRKAVS